MPDLTVDFAGIRTGVGKQSLVNRQQVPDVLTGSNLRNDPTVLVMNQLVRRQVCEHSTARVAEPERCVIAGSFNAEDFQTASSSLSPVRIRIASSTGRINIFPSPTLPVRAIF